VYKRESGTFYDVPPGEALLLMSAMHGLRAMDAIHVVSASLAALAFTACLQSRSKSRSNGALRDMR